jgi:integrase
MPNRNHPPQGAIIRVEPIRSQQAIAAIEALLESQPRNRAIFCLGTNTNLRAIDMLKLTVGEVLGLLPGDSLVVREKKTKKLRRIVMNRKVILTLETWLAEHPDPRPGAPLFQSRGREAPLTVSSLNNLVKLWCRQVGLRGNYGSHSLRKTFGYIHRVVYGTDIPTLMVMFNHSSQKQTLAYLGIEEAEVRDAYLKEI